MTRQEYLTALENLLPSLSDEERSEALRYYTDYFEDANDDEKVINELGSVDELAQQIIEKFAGVPAPKENPKKENYDEFVEDDNDDSSKNFYEESLVFNFLPADVKHLEIDLSGCHTVFIKGSSWNIETRGLLSDEFECKIENDSSLYIHQTKKISQYFSFFGHERKTRLVPRILISVPEKIYIETFKLTMGAGNYVFKDVSMNVGKFYGILGAGNAEIKNIRTKNMKLKCGMGKIDFCGYAAEKIFLDCGLGEITLKLDDASDMFSYDCNVGLGEFNFDGKKKSGVQKSYTEKEKIKHISANVGLGSIKVSFIK